LELTIQVTYREPGDPADSTCVATQKFEYPRDGTPPAPPTVQVLAGMNSTWPRANCIDTPNRTVQVNITAAAADAERGVQYLCRDLSWQQVWNTYSGPIYGAQVCIRGGAFLGPAQILPYSPNPLMRNATDREPRWVPCPQLR
ncbi:MAG TPA: hypothetical protein PKC28_15090, partial [Bdellovibrionales bacterium]|nr:hypothetical protein [Bdellovibrionales bacterium]